MRIRGYGIAAVMMLCLVVVDASAAPAAKAWAAPLDLQITNTLALARHDEVLSLPLAELLQRRPQWRSRQLAARLAGKAGLLPVQRYASDGGTVPDRLLVLLDMPSQAHAKLEIFPTAAGTNPGPDPLYARLVPERHDDFAWENEQVAYRIYGKALEATGQVFSGIDVWSKRPPRLVIDAWYRRDADALRSGNDTLSYHVDQGDGLDSYEVGHTPGDGGTAAWLDGKPVYSRNATRVRITAMGPVRLRFEVDYAPWRVGHALLRERKVITLDAGAHLNRQAVTFRMEGASRLTVAAGVAAHAGARVMHDGAAQIAVWDTPQTASAGHIATGLLLPPHEKARYMVCGGAAWILFDVVDGTTIHFASGAGWSKGDVPGFSDWQRHLANARWRQAHPLHWRWIGS